MNFVISMIFPTIFSAIAQLRKDRGTWIGGVSSTFATVLSKDGFLPTTLESWLAVVLTFCTIVYMIMKVIFLYKGKIKQVQELEDV